MADSPPPDRHKAQRAEQAAAAFPPLLIAAERLAATVAQGVHGRRRAGPGDTFWQFRRYQAGDPLQAVDWRQTARAERAYVREREWEAAQTAALWCAGGPGMAWRSRPEVPTKRERGTLLTLALAALLLRGGERVGLLGAAIRPAAGRTVLYRLAETLERAEETAGPDILEPAAAPLPRHTNLVLFGDFLDPIAPLARTLRDLAGRGARGHVVQILDPAEESLPYSGRVRFTAPGGAGDGGQWLVNRTEDIRDAYVARLHAHREALRDLTRSLGWSFALHHTDTPPQAALLGLHQTLSGTLAGGRRP